MGHNENKLDAAAKPCCDISAAEGAQIAEDCRKQGAESADPWGVNLTDPKALDDFSKQVLEKYGTVDILVNCAGIIPSSEGVGQGRWPT